MTQAARILTSLVTRLILGSIRKRISSHSLVRSLVGCLLALSVTALAQRETPHSAKPTNILKPPQPAPGPGRFIDITTKSHLTFVGQASHTSKKYLLETMG